MKNQKLEIFLGFMFMLFSLNGLSAQEIIWKGEQFTIFQAIKNGKAIYTGEYSDGTKVPITESIMKSSDLDNKDSQNKLNNCNRFCYPCGENYSDVCCSCANYSKGTKITVKKLENAKIVFEDLDFKLFAFKEKGLFKLIKTSYVGLDKAGYFVKVKVKTPKGSVVKPSDGCYKCSWEGNIKVCEFYKCK